MEKLFSQGTEEPLIITYCFPSFTSTLIKKIMYSVIKKDEVCALRPGLGRVRWFNFSGGPLTDSNALTPMFTSRNMPRGNSQRWGKRHISKNIIALFGVATKLNDSSKKEKTFKCSVIRK